MKAVHVRVGERPEVIDLPRSPSLVEWQKLVGGYIEPFDGIIGGPQLRAYVNADGIGSCNANRAVYATLEMAEMGYLSQLDFSHRVGAGDLYTIVFGDFVVYAGDDDDEGEMVLRDMTEEEIAAVCKAPGIRDPESGTIAVMALRAAR